MDEIIEKIYAAIRKAGYEYAKDYYENWAAYFSDGIADESSFYYDSLGMNGYPIKEIFEDQMSDQVSHSYYSGSNDDLFEEFNIQGFTQSERDLVKDQYLFDTLWDGVCDFIEETY